jgi:hypothetical protein
MSDGAKVIYFPVSFFFSFGNICSLRTWSIIEHGSSAPHHIGSYIYSILFHAERISFKKKKERVDHQINFYIASPKKNPILSKQDFKYTTRHEQDFYMVFIGDQELQPYIFWRIQLYEREAGGDDEENDSGARLIVPDC